MAILEARALMERLGDSPGFGYLLLELLGLNGWDIARTTAFAGVAIDADDEPVESDQPAVLVIASKGGYEIRRTGESVAAVAFEVFKEAANVQPFLPLARIA